MESNSATCTGIEYGRNDDLIGLVESLSEGDSILVNDREHPLKVCRKSRETIGGNVSETTTVYLQLRGRTYRLRGKYHWDASTTEFPMLELRKEGEWTKLSDVTQIKLDSGKKIVSDTSAADWLSELDSR